MSATSGNVDKASSQSSKESIPPPSNLAVYVFSFLVVFRLLNALCIATFFQPDEYFQSLEPAWQLAFGDASGAWITWEWHNRLRSSTYPGLFALIYYGASRMAQALHLSDHARSTLFVFVPKLVQGFLAAVGDFFTWRLAQVVYGKRSMGVSITLFMTVLSPWQWFCSTRTLSNSLETVLTVAALRLWPWDVSGVVDEREVELVVKGEQRVSADRTVDRPTRPFTLNLYHTRLSLTLAGLACILRPTNLLIWMPLVLFYIYNVLHMRNNYVAKQTLMTMSRESIVCGTMVLILSGLSDRLYYGAWTFPPYQWLNFNITKSLAVFYGVNDWHYYLSQGLPLLLTTFLPFGLLGLWSATSIAVNKQPSPTEKISLQLAVASIFMIATLSCISHKEVRFIYPLLPVLHILAAPHFEAFFLAGSSINHQDSSMQMLSKMRRVRVAFLSLLVLANCAISIYTSQVHQRGVVDVVDFLRRDFALQHSSPSASAEGNPQAFVGFLMPCHSTPWRSHLVFPDLHAWALTCEPPLDIPAGTAARTAYRDEADRFYDDPASFLENEFNTTNRPWPQYIAGFQGIEGVLENYRDKNMPTSKIVERWRGFNSHFHDDGRRLGDVVVWEIS